jgi:hypothetical protein
LKSLAIHCWILIFSSLALAQLDSPAKVTTQRFNNQRTGANTNETQLRVSQVNAQQFGKLFLRTVDGEIYGQPLYMPGIKTGSSVHNLVFVVTMHNSVFAFDADDPKQPNPIWVRNLGPSIPTQDLSKHYTDIFPEIGITSTPVIDPQSSTLFVVAATKDSSTGAHHQTLWALDLTNGQIRLSTEIQGSSGQVPFDPQPHLQRPALLLEGGRVYVAFGSHGDYSPYHGWIFAYDSKTLNLLSVINLTPSGDGGSLWQGGVGPSSDLDGNIYVATANGSFTPPTTVDGSDGNYGNSIIKLGASPLLHIIDFFTPSNQDYLSQHDLDLGAGGVLVIPKSSSIALVGKDGIFRRLHRDRWGGLNTAANPIAQEFPMVRGPYFGAPLYWNHRLYIWGDTGVLKVFAFDGEQLLSTPIDQSSVVVPSGFSNMPSMAISADGNDTATGILWALMPSSGDALQTKQPGILYAFDASHVGQMLWNSDANPSDHLGIYMKFVPPTVVNGKVFVATGSHQLVVYGRHGDF